MFRPHNKFIVATFLLLVSEIASKASAVPLGFRELILSNDETLSFGLYYASPHMEVSKSVCLENHTDEEVKEEVKIVGISLQGDSPFHLLSSYHSPLLLKPKQKIPLMVQFKQKDPLPAHTYYAWLQVTMEHSAVPARFPCEGKLLEMSHPSSIFSQFRLPL